MAAARAPEAQTDAPTDAQALRVAAPECGAAPAPRAGDFVLASGQVPVGPDRQVVAGGVAEQTRRVIENLRAALAHAGCALSDVLKTAVRRRTAATSPSSTRPRSGSSPPARAEHRRVAALDRHQGRDRGGGPPLA